MFSRKLFFPALALGAAMTLSSCAGSATPNNQAKADSAAQLQLNEQIRSQLPQQVLDSGKLTFGTTANNAPFSMKPGDELEGMLPELGAELSSVLGVEVVLEPMAFPGLVPAMEAGRIDGIWTLMTATEDREKSMDMLSYMKNSNGFMTLSDAPPLESVEDLCTLRLSTVRGGTIQEMLEQIADDCAAAGHQRPQISYFDDRGAGQTQLRAGRVDTFAGITVPLRYVAEQVDNGTVFTISDLELQGGAQAFALPKGGADELGVALQAAFQELVSSGRYEQILTEYGAQNEALTAEQIVFNPATSGVLDEAVRTEAE